MSSLSSNDWIFNEDEMASTSPPAKNEIFMGDFAYSLENLVTEGTTASVYKGRQVSTSQRIAVKIIPKMVFASECRAEIANAEQMMQLAHPNIVTLYGNAADQDHYYLFIEYCNNRDLSGYLENLGTLSETTIKFYLRQLAEGIGFLHSKGLIHRNLNPDNIMLHSKERDPTPLEMFVKISNFGFTRTIDDDGGPMTFTMSGSPLYSAPEIALDKKHDFRADLWSIGAIIHKCFTGAPPVKVPVVAIINEIYQNPKEFTLLRPLGISNELWHLLSGLLELEMENRISFENFYNHPYICDAPTLPAPRKSIGEGSDMSLPSTPSYSPTSPPSVFDNMELQEEQAQLPQPIHEGGTPKDLEGVKYAPDSADLQYEDFVFVPIVDTDDGLTIDPVYNTDYDVILPCVRTPRIVPNPPGPPNNPDSSPNQPTTSTNKLSY